MSLSGVVLQAKRAQSGRGLMGGVAGEMTKQAVTTVGAVTHQTRALVRDKLGGGGGSGRKSAYCSYRRPGFSSQHTTIHFQGISTGLF